MSDNEKTFKIPSQILTPSEQKLLDEQLKKLKRRSSDSVFLTDRANDLRRDIIAKRTPEQQEKLKTPSFQRKIFLPMIFPVIADKKMSPLSNWIAKSAIFAPRPPEKRRDTGSDWEELNSPRGVKILYNGPELDMSDHTLYLNLMKLAEGRGPNEMIAINRAQLLRSCGYRSIGKSSYDWLSQAFDRLMQANIKICIDNSVLIQENIKIFSQDVNETKEINGRSVSKVNLILKIMGELIETPETGDYYFTLPSSSLVLFSNALYGYNDLQKRNKIQRGKRGDLAAWLQSYICADCSGRHHPILAETLRCYSGSKSRLNDFTDRLKIALDNLIEHEVILTWKIYQNENGEDLIVWTR